MDRRGFVGWLAGLLPAWFAAKAATPLVASDELLPVASEAMLPPSTPTTLPGAQGPGGDSYDWFRAEFKRCWREDEEARLREWGGNAVERYLVPRRDFPHTCAHCGISCRLSKGPTLDGLGMTVVDITGGDVCGWNGGNEPHAVYFRNEWGTWKGGSGEYAVYSPQNRRLPPNKEGF